MKYYSVFVFFLLGISLHSSTSHRVPFYRTDYTYFEDFDAFYKLHWNNTGLSWKAAFYACADERATLFYPKAKNEWTVVKNLTESMAEVLNVTDIFVGFHDEFKLGEFITVDGHVLPDALTSDANLQPDPRVSGSSLLVDPMAFGDSALENTLAPDNSLPRLDGNCITMNANSGSYKKADCFRTPDTALPFVCKKVAEKSCPTVDRGYKYNNASRKCYKVNKKSKLWQEAMKTCFIEGGTLAVIENRAQADEVRDMIKDAVSYFVGVRKITTQHPVYKTFQDTYYTVKGKKISEMYQNKGQYDQSQDYGTVRKENKFLYTETANHKARLPFICEMEVSV